jgi:hypothetical protein
VRALGLYSIQTVLAHNGFTRRRTQRRRIGLSPASKVSISKLRTGRVTFGLLADGVRHAARRNRDLAKSTISLERNPARPMKLRKSSGRGSELR